MLEIAWVECMSKVTEEHDSSERIRIPILPPSISNLIYQRISKFNEPQKFWAKPIANTGYINVTDVENDRWWRQDDVDDSFGHQYQHVTNITVILDPSAISV